MSSGLFNPTDIVIDAFVERMQENYVAIYSNAEPAYPGIIAFVGRMALEIIANSDAAYHDVSHTIMVTAVGQEILRGKHLRLGGVGPRDWLHFAVSLLCHDIGYVRGACAGDRDGQYVKGVGDETVTLAPGATDAALTPYHIERGKRFVKERFSGTAHIDPEVVMANIDRTQFPVPTDGVSKETADMPGLLRAADLIGQLADPDYMRKIAGLYFEFHETGTAEKLGYHSPADLRAGYPKFFWGAVEPYLEPALSYLSLTQAGRQWIANLYGHVFAEEHSRKALGPERNR